LNKVESTVRLIESTVAQLGSFSLDRFNDIGALQQRVKELETLRLKDEQKQPKLMIFPDYWQQKLEAAADRGYEQFTIGRHVRYDRLDEIKVGNNWESRRVKWTGRVIPRPHGYPVVGTEGRQFIWVLMDVVGADGQPGAVRGCYPWNLGLMK
jgi:hypothetical protein